MEIPIEQVTPKTFQETARDRAFLARLVNENGALRSLIMDCNRYPLRGAHQSWIPPHWPARIYESLQGSRAESRMAGLIMGHWGFPNQAAFTFSEPSHRICLMQQATLERLALFTGVALRWESFSKILERERLQDLKAEIGEDAYLFAIQSAPLLAGESPTRATEPPDAEIAGCGAAVRRSGMAILSACVAKAPRALRVRLALKFHRDRAEVFLTDSTVLPQAKAWPLVKRVLLQEVDPSWDHLLS